MHLCFYPPIFFFKRLLRATKNIEVFHLHIQENHTIAKLTLLTQPHCCVYKHTGFLKETEITGGKHMIKSHINPHLNIKSKKDYMFSFMCCVHLPVNTDGRRKHWILFSITLLLISVMWTSLWLYWLLFILMSPLSLGQIYRHVQPCLAKSSLCDSFYLILK